MGHSGKRDPAPTGTWWSDSSSHAAINNEDLCVRRRVGSDVVTNTAGRVGGLAVGVFVRRVKTASGATAAQIVHKRGRRVLSIEHVGSAHTDGELAVLLHVAGERRHAGQLALDLGGGDAVGAGTPAVVEGTASLIL